MRFFSGVPLFAKRMENVENERIFKALEEEYRMLVFQFDDEVKPAGWIHSFFCDDCLSPLMVNGETIICSNCGKDYTRDEKKKFASIMHKRYRISEALVFASFMSNLGVNDWKTGIMRVLDFYAENLEKFKAISRISDEFPKITSQFLNDAMITMNLLIPILTIDFPNEKVLYWKERIFDPIDETLSERKIEIHNHSVWILSALALKQLAFSEGRLGYYVSALEEIAKRGFLKNGFWFEGSFHYHFYTLEGFVKFYLPYVDVTKRRSEILDGELEKAFIAPLEFAFPDGRFPNPGDGWPKIGLNTYSNILEYGCQLFENDKLKRILSIARGGLFSGTDIPVYGKRIAEGFYPERFYFDNECEDRSHREFSNNNESFGPGESVYVSKGKWNVFLKSGQSSNSHIHEDICSFEVYMGLTPVSVDLSNSGYGMSEWKSWFAKGLSHNTFFVNGKAEKFIGPMYISKDKERFGCVMKENPFEYRFQRWIQVGDTLKISSCLEKTGAKLGMSFVFPYPSEFNGFIFPPDVEASDQVSWTTKLKNSAKLVFENFSVKIHSNGASIFIGNGFWIPKDRKVTVIYLENFDTLEVNVEILGRCYG